MADSDSGMCDQLAKIHEVRPSANGCEGFLKIGDTWVHLRLCEICGHVGCCDNAKNKHVTFWAIPERRSSSSRVIRNVGRSEYRYE